MYKTQVFDGVLLIFWYVNFLKSCVQVVFDSFIYVNLQCKFVSYLTIFWITMNGRGRVNEGERGKEVEKEREWTCEEWEGISHSSGISLFSNREYLFQWRPFSSSLADWDAFPSDTHSTLSASLRVSPTPVFGSVHSREPTRSQLDKLDIQ